MPRSDDRDRSLAKTDCRSCGACCISYEGRYARVMGNDHERLGELADELTYFIENRCFMRIEEERCAALQIEPETGLFRCRVYPLRPDVCRQLEPGSPQCDAERIRKAERAREALRACRTRGSGAE